MNFITVKCMRTTNPHALIEFEHRINFPSRFILQFLLPGFFLLLGNPRLSRFLRQFLDFRTAFRGAALYGLRTFWSRRCNSVVFICIGFAFPLHWG